MPSFTKGGGQRTPFGSNEYLRSTQDVKKESYTVAAASVPDETIDGVVQKMLLPGEVMAKITSGPDAGKIGPFMAAGTKEVQTLTKAGTVSGGTFTITFKGETTAPIAWNAVAADVQAALIALSTVGTGGVTVTGGPLNTGAFSVTFNLNGDQPAMTTDVTDLEGSGAGVTVATSTGGSGANDGRQTVGNIVGLNDTWLPWQLMEHDNEVAVTYECTAVQAWCFERDSSGARTALGNTTAGNLSNQKSMGVIFK
jgi:hypothetical protein